jgi:hypothetical protein
MKTHPYLAASPDALVFEGHEEGLLEIKSLYTFKNLTINESLKTAKSEKKNFPLMMKNEQLTLKQSSAHYTQIQGQLLVTQKQFCDYFLCTSKDYHLERIYPNRIFMNKLRNRLEYFFQYCLAPELVSPRKNKGGIRLPAKSYIEFGVFNFF